MRESRPHPRSAAPARAGELSRHVDAVCRALDILDCFQAQPVFTLGELAAAAGLTRNRATRLVGTLESRGYLRYEAEPKGYRLGSRLLTLGKIFEANTSVTALARPVLRELVRLTGEMASLYVRDSLERVALARELGTQPIGYTLVEGERMALHAGAAGKTLLAYAPPPILRAALRRERLARLTPRTIVDPALLTDELARIRRQGWAFSLGERAPDAASIAAPVFDHQNQVCAALGIAGPAHRFSARQRQRHARIVMERARSLSERLGWSAAHPEGGTP